MFEVLGTMIQKLLESIIIITISVITAFILVTTHIKNNFDEIKSVNSKVSELTNKIDTLESKLKLYTDGVEDLVGIQKIDYTKQLQKLTQVAENNSQLVEDLNKLVIKDPEKVLALKQLNMEVISLKESVSELKVGVDKNDDRIHNNLSTILNFALALLAIAVGAKIILSWPRHGGNAS